MRATHKVTYRMKQAVGEADTICPAPCKLTFDLESGDVRKYVIYANTKNCKVK